MNDVPRTWQHLCTVEQEEQIEEVAEEIAALLPAGTRFMTCEIDVDDHQQYELYGYPPLESEGETLQFEQHFLDLKLPDTVHVGSQEIVDEREII